MPALCKGMPLLTCSLGDHGRPYNPFACSIFSTLFRKNIQ